MIAQFGSHVYYLQAQVGFLAALGRSLVLAADAAGTITANRMEMSFRKFFFSVFFSTFFSALILSCAPGVFAATEACSESLQAPLTLRSTVIQFEGRALTYQVPIRTKNQSVRPVIEGEYKIAEITRPDDLVLGISEFGHVFLELNGRRLEGRGRPFLKMKTMAWKAYFYHPSFLFVFKNVSPEFKASFEQKWLSAKTIEPQFFSTCASMAVKMLNEMGVSNVTPSFSARRLVIDLFRLQQANESAVEIINLTRMRPDQLLAAIGKQEFSSLWGNLFKR